MTILWEEMVFLTKSADEAEETMEMDAASVTSNVSIEMDLIIVMALLFSFFLTQICRI